jgi:Methyltransferase domain
VACLMSAATFEHRKACVALATAAGAKTIVEIGVKSGRLSRMLAEVPTLKHLFLIDSWEGETKDRQPPYFLPYNQQSMDACASTVKEWARTEPKVTVLHMRSTRAARLIANTIDFVYIDGDHTAAGVTADIETWFPKVKSGGIVCGDDYNMPTVQEVVDTLLPNRQIDANGRLWWVRK